MLPEKNDTFYDLKKIRDFVLAESDLTWKCLVKS